MRELPDNIDTSTYSKIVYFINSELILIIIRTANLINKLSSK